MNSSLKPNNPGDTLGSESQQEATLSALGVGVSSSRVAFATLNLLNHLRDATQQDIEAQILSVLLIVAQRESDPPNVLELAKLASVSEATASRAVASLGRGLRGKPGAGLVETMEDPTNYSRKLVRLTAKGQRLMQRIGDGLINSVPKWV